VEKLGEILGFGGIDAYLFPCFPDKSHERVFTRAHMTAYSCIPLVGVHILGGGPPLKKNLALGVEDLQVHHQLYKACIRVAFPTGSLSYRISLLIHKQKHLITHTGIIKGNKNCINTFHRTHFSHIMEA
jgi:hypothetical protein